MAKREKQALFDQIDDPHELEPFAESITEVHATKKGKNKSQENSLGKEVFAWVRDLVIVIVVVLLMTNFVAEKIRVVGASMEPTVHNGDHFILDKLSYRFNTPDRFDIIAFPYDDELNYIKRIIGLPGDEINLIKNSNGTFDIYVNGLLTEDSYGREAILRPGNQSYPLIVPIGTYFVLGDNRNDSSDSRYVDVGTIPKEVIMGKAFLRIWPLSDFGLVQ